MEKVVDFLKKNVFYLATSNGYQPEVRPFGVASLINGELYIFTSNDKSVYRQMMDNPMISISAMDKNGNTLRLYAEAMEDLNRDVIESFLEDNAELKAQYSVDDGVATPIRLANVRAVLLADGGTVDLLNSPA